MTNQNDDLAHEIWAAAQTPPGDSIEGAVARINALLSKLRAPKPLGDSCHHCGWMDWVSHDGAAYCQACGKPHGSVPKEGLPNLPQLLRENADLDEAEGGNPQVCTLERDAADEIERLRREVAKLRAPVADERQALAHVANEWADMACNAMVWIRNIQEGISTPEEALANLKANLTHCREVQSCAGVRASAPVADTWTTGDDDLDMALNMAGVPGDGALAQAEAVERLKARLASAPVAGEAQPVAWFRKTDITEWTDTEPETDGWTPLFDHAAPQASEAVRDAAAERLHALVREAISWLETGGGRADSLCADLRKALSAQPGAKKDGGSDGDQ